MSNYIYVALKIAISVLILLYFRAYITPPSIFNTSLHTINIPIQKGNKFSKRIRLQECKSHYKKPQYYQNTWHVTVASFELERG